MWVYLFLQFAKEITFYEEFDPGSGLTLAVRLTHASRARTSR